MNPWRGLADLPREAWILFATTLVNRAGTMALPFMVLYLTEHLGIPPSRAGGVLAIYGAAALATAPLAGRLCDRMGHVRVMRASLAVSGLLVLAFPLARSFAAVAALTVAWSAASEAFRPASLAVTAEIVPPERRKAAFALIRLAVNLGMSIGPPVGGFLAAVSYPALFVVDGATSILAVALLVASRWPAQAPVRTGAGEGFIGVAACGDRRAVFFLLALLPSVLVFFQLLGAFPLYLVRDLRMAESAYGLLLAVNTVLIIFVEVPLNLAMARWSHRHGLALGAALTAAGLAATGLASSGAALVATVVVWTFGEMIFLPASNAYMADLAPAGRRGEYMGLYQMTFSLAFMLGPWLGTVVLERVGGAALWSGALACGILSAALLSRVSEPSGAGQP